MAKNSKESLYQGRTVLAGKIRGHRRKTRPPRGAMPTQPQPRPGTESRSLEGRPLLGASLKTGRTSGAYLLRTSFNGRTSAGRTSTKIAQVWRRAPRLFRPKPAPHPRGLRLGMRHQTHRARDASSLHTLPEAAGHLRHRSPILESQAWTSAGAANAVRLALWSQAHGKPDAQNISRHAEGGRGFERLQIDVPPPRARDLSQSRN